MKERRSRMSWGTNPCGEIVLSGWATSVLGHYQDGHSRRRKKIKVILNKIKEDVSDRI